MLRIKFKKYEKLDSSDSRKILLKRRGVWSWVTKKIEYYDEVGGNIFLNIGWP